MLLLLLFSCVILRLCSFLSFVSFYFSYLHPAPTHPLLLPHRMLPPLPLEQKGIGPPPPRLTCPVRSLICITRPFQMHGSEFHPAGGAGALQDASSTPLTPRRCRHARNVCEKATGSATGEVSLMTGWTSGSSRLQLPMMPLCCGRPAAQLLFLQTNMSFLGADRNKHNSFFLLSILLLVSLSAPPQTLLKPLLCSPNKSA